MTNLVLAIVFLIFYPFFKAGLREFTLDIVKIIVFPISVLWRLKKLKQLMKHS